MGALGVLGVGATERLLRSSIQLGYQLSRISGGIRRVWGADGEAMISFLKELAVRTGIAVDQLMRAGITLEGLTGSAEKTRRIVTIASEIGAAMDLTSEQVREIAESIGRLGDPNIAARALFRLRRLGLPLQGVTAETPNLQSAVLSRLQARYGGALGALQELDSIMSQLGQAARVFLAETAGPILRLLEAIAAPGNRSGVIQLIVRLNTLSKGWLGFGLILALGATSTYLLVRAFVQLMAAMKALEVVAKQTAAATATAAATQGVGAAATKLGGAALASRIPYIGAILAALLAGWAIWDVIKGLRGDTGKQRDARNELRRIGDNTEEMADSMKEVAATLIGAGERAKRLGATMELQIALNRAIATGVG